MDYSTLKDTILLAVESMSGRAPHKGWRGVRHLAEQGELEEAMDVLVAIVVRDSVPITVAERRTLADLMGEFECDAADRELYVYLSDTEMLDRMTVVDEPAP